VSGGGASAEGSEDPNVAIASEVAKNARKLKKAVVEADKASKVAETKEAAAVTATTRADAVAYLEAPRRRRELPQFLTAGTLSTKFWFRI